MAFGLRCIWSGEIFRYAATKDPKALQNCRESARSYGTTLYHQWRTGFPSRSFERTGYKYEDKPWRRTEDPNGTGSQPPAAMK
ncbi:MAG: hypothetical protein R2822_30630 [Spirosomataceae bacterium]